MTTHPNQEEINFLTTPYPTFHKDTQPVRTVACVIIGDEILNGKTLDTNSNHLASLSFSLGIQLKKIEVIPDQEDVIVSCIKRLCEPEHEFDMIITSGGIGPTHDDITYQSLAKVFDPHGELEYDQETIRRMEEHTSRKKNMITKTEEQRIARHRMGLFPKKNSKVLFVQPNLWVPVVSLANKIFILPGVPILFQQLLQALLLNYIPLPPETEKPNRVLIETTLPESLIAPMLTKFTEEFKQSKQDIKLGSYPNLITGRVSISLIGTQLEKINSIASLIKTELDLITQSSNVDNN